MDRITESDLMAEIDAALVTQGNSHHLRVMFTPEQDAALLRARPGRPGGLQWPRLMAIWQGQGWPGSENTIRKRYRELEAGN